MIELHVQYYISEPQHHSLNANDHFFCHMYVISNVDILYLHSKVQWTLPLLRCGHLLLQGSMRWSLIAAATLDDGVREGGMLLRQKRGTENEATGFGNLQQGDKCVCACVWAS